MPFLIFTRAGFDDIVARVDPADAAFCVNPGLLTNAEIARLREAGAIVHVLESAANPLVAQELELALRAAAREGEIVWIERAESKPDAQQSSASAQARRRTRPAQWVAGWPRPLVCSPVPRCAG